MCNLATELFLDFILFTGFELILQEAKEIKNTADETCCI